MSAGRCKFSDRGNFIRRRSFLILTAILAVSAVAPGATSMARHTPVLAQADTNTACRRSLALTTDLMRKGKVRGKVPIWRLEGKSAFFFETGMTIDADGAPNAYNPENTGLDNLANAGEPGHWIALAVDRAGTPYIQSDEDPFPGYYVSTTALWDRTKRRGDTRRFVNASKIPYIVLPRDVAQEIGARLGDFAEVFYLRDGSRSAAIFADLGPSVGEGSIALANNLGIRSDPRRGGARGEVLYVVFPGSGNHKPRSLQEIDRESSTLIENLGGAGRITACAAE